MAEYTGLDDGVTAVLIGTYTGLPIHAPGPVVADRAVAVPDGADAISGLAEREDLFGPAASMPTRGGCWTESMATICSRLAGCWVSQPEVARLEPL